MALAVAATTAKTLIGELVRLARDSTLGDSTDRLRRSKSEIARSALNELSHDPDLAKEIASWRPRKKKTARSGGSEIKELASEALIQRLSDPKKAIKNRTQHEGVSARAAAVFSALRDEASLRKAFIEPMQLARRVDSILERFPNALGNLEAMRSLRTALYRDLLALPPADIERVVDNALAALS